MDNLSNSSSFHNKLKENLIVTVILLPNHSWSSILEVVTPHLSSGLAGIPKSPDLNFLLTSSICSWTVIKLVKKGQKPKS